MEIVEFFSNHFIYYVYREDCEVVFVTIDPESDKFWSRTYLVKYDPYHKKASVIDDDNNVILVLSLDEDEFFTIFKRANKEEHREKYNALKEMIFSKIERYPY